MMRLLALAVVVLAGAVQGRSDMVTERWGSGAQGRHPESAEYSAAEGGGTIIKYDLSALKGAKVIRARLLVNVKSDGFPLPEPIVVQPLTKPCEENAKPAVEEQALALAAPRYTALDATDLVQRWVSGKPAINSSGLLAGKLANNGVCFRGPALNKTRTFLEVAYEGALKDPPPPVTGLKAFHRAGQVFLTWREVNNKLADQQEVTWREFKDETSRPRLATYRVYRHTKPITPQMLAQAELLDEIGQFSCFDPQMVQTEWKGEQIKNVKVDDARVPRTAVEPKTELPPGTGVFVRTTAKPGEYYYAVISTAEGVENTTQLGPGCATSQPLKEAVAPPEPILFRAVQMMYQQERTLFCYVWWVDAPLSNGPRFVHVGVSAGPKVGNPPAVQPPAAEAPRAEQAKSIEALVKQLADENPKLREQAEAELVKVDLAAIPALEQAQRLIVSARKPAKPGEVVDEATKAAIDAENNRIAAARREAARILVETRIRNRDKAGAAPLLVHGYWWSGGWCATHPGPQEDGLTLAIDDHPWHVRGVHEGNGTYKAWGQGQVQNYYVRQIKALLPWVKANFNADLDRVYAFSGGWAWHYPEIFAATFEVLSMNPKRSPAMPEVRRYWNDPKSPPPTEWGQSPYEYWNTGEWIRNNPAVELAHMSYSPYQHTGDFGKLDKPAFYAAMRDTKHAFATNFDESRGWYGTHDAAWIFQIRKSDSIAAFTNCTLDDDPGVGLGGDPGGQINGWTAFDARGQVDEPDRWEMTLYLLSGGKSADSAAPVDECRSDVTPRRCQKFKAKPGEKFTWTNTSLAGGKVVQSDQSVADKNGLVTAERVIISKGKNRLVFQRAK